MPAKVRKAVFPAAGLGTRFLPATKAMAKEMLTLVDKPIIQYGVEEAVNSGLKDMIIVTGRGKAAMEDHFDISFELETMLESRGKTELLALARSISDISDVSYIRQKQALGLGHAVSRAADLVGDETFCCVLPDDVIVAERPCLRQLLDIYEAFDGPVLAVMEVPGPNISAYGVVAAEPVEYQGTMDRVFRVHDMVEKPDAANAPSNLAIIGRYVLTPDIFEAIGRVKPGAGGEIQLTDALKDLMSKRPIYAFKFEGKRYDAGDKFGFLQATVELALRHETLGAPFREYLRGLEY